MGGSAALTILAVVSPYATGAATGFLLPAPMPLRVVAGAAVIAPLGLFMGIMFPKGIAYLEQRAPQLVAWAWGINGTLSVISAVLAALLALAFNFRFVLVTGAAAYGLAALLTVRPARLLLGSGERDKHHAAEVLAGD